MPPLVCNTTTYKHSDFQHPISAYKSTDYRTSTGKNHRFIPSIPQEFDARIKYDPGNVKNKIVVKNDYRSDYRLNIKGEKSVKNPLNVGLAENYQKVHYFRDFQEKLFQNPAPPLCTRKSTTHEDYQRQPIIFPKRTVFPPNPYSYCEVAAYGRDEQPPLPTEENGYIKYSDNYLTTNRADYIPYNQRKQEGIAKKDIITYWDASGVPRGGKGYGPRNSVKIEAMVPRREPPVVKKKKSPLHSEMLPHRSYLPESKEQYCSQTYSNFYPYLFENGIEFKDSLANATAWQTLVAPGMYCTENCHYGTGWPVRSVIEVKKPEKQYIHKIPSAMETC